MAKKNKNRIRSVVEPFSPKQIRRETRARVRLEFGDADRALRGDLRASRQQSKNLNAWYQQYQGNMERLRQGQLANTNALQEQSRASAGLMNQAATAQREALDAEEQRSAALRGASTSGAGATEAAGETQRQALMTSTRDRNAQIGSSAYNRLAEVNAAAGLGLQADQRRERGTRLETRSKMRDLARDKGASRIKNRADIIRGERDFNIQNRTLNANIADDRADNALDRQREARLASQGSGGSGGSSGGGGRSVDRQDVGRGVALLDGQVTTTDNWMSFKTPKGQRKAFYYLRRNGLSPAEARRAIRRFTKRKQREINNTPNSSGAGQPGSNTG